MENKICAVIRDILPLYCDNAVSEESKKIIEGHLEGCEGCRQYKKELKEAGNVNVSNNKNAISNETANIKQIADRLRRRKRNIVIGVSAAFVLALIVLSQIFQISVIAGTSMEPTYSDKQDIIINRMSYRFSSPKRGDIIYFSHNDVLSIKRVIGLPEETIELKNGKLYIDGELLEENYFDREVGNPGDITYPVTLGNDEYFVIGDNLDNSLDSRQSAYGMIQRDEVLGKVIR
ncbi:signal peptidase I [Anaeromicropila populeti]|uniref:Signal peptidase I n=1 Tax=Anaeromicropila populeti TaxID=37658 RepID=A0A1I6IFJ4_9FIRM|nr:signal peptidase I [Anaeromicropila populeti]SFR65453.1 signal peptidase I [Anaeromicropila populeti]